VLSIKGALRGRRGIQWLDQAGPYAVVTNKRLHIVGRASKFVVVNPREHLVASVHDTPDEARTLAQALSANAVN
jgi:hypothetical protein